MKKGNMIPIEWGNKQTVITQFDNVADFENSKYLERYAKKFGYSHLVEEKLDRLRKMDNLHNIFITEANPKFNYGLDFKMYKYYTIEEGIMFMNEITLGGISITSRPLQRVRLEHKTTPFYEEYMEYAISDDLEENKKDFMKKNAEKFSKEYEKVSNYRKNNIVDNFSFSMNVGYKKDREFRAELADLSKTHRFIFA
jgi:hypothetical protein